MTPACTVRVIWRNRPGAWVLVLCAVTQSFAQTSAPEPLATPLLNACTATLRESPTAAADVDAVEASPTIPPPVPCNTEREQRQFAARFVEEKLAVWRQRLKLENWKISVVMIRRSDLKPKTLGGIRWDKGKKSAVISVLDTSEYRLPFHAMLDDMEFTIVHELVHLELAALPRSEASRTNEEISVNQIAEALIGLDRHK